MSFFPFVSGMTERLDVAHRLSTTKPTEAFTNSQFGSIEGGKAESARFCKTWENEVKKAVSADRLLVNETEHISYFPFLELDYFSFNHIFHL